MGKMSLSSCRALSTPGKFSNVDRYANPVLKSSKLLYMYRETNPVLKSSKLLYMYRETNPVL